MIWGFVAKGFPISLLLASMVGLLQVGSLSCCPHHCFQPIELIFFLRHSSWAGGVAAMAGCEILFKVMPAQGPGIGAVVGLAVERVYLAGKLPVLS